jgi:hypothetical protein
MKLGEIGCEAKNFAAIDDINATFSQQAVSQVGMLRAQRLRPRKGCQLPG